MFDFLNHLSCTAIQISTCSYVVCVINTIQCNMTKVAAACSGMVVAMPSNDTLPTVEVDICNNHNQTAVLWTGMSEFFNANCDFASSIFTQGVNCLQQTVSKSVCPGPASQGSLTHTVILASLAAMFLFSACCIYRHCANKRVYRQHSEFFDSCCPSKKSVRQLAEANLRTMKTEDQGLPPNASYEQLVPSDSLSDYQDPLVANLTSAESPRR